MQYLDLTFVRNLPNEQTPYQSRAFGPLISEHRARIDALIRTYRIGALKVARKLSNCCRYPQIVAIDSIDRYYLTEQRCKSRVCPRCSKIRAKQLAGRIAALVQRMDAPRFLTLSLRSNHDPLRDQINYLRRKFAAMRRRPEWTSHVTSGVYTIQVTYNGETQAWHPHLHTIIDGVFWQQRELLRLWESILRDHGSTDIRAVHGVRKLANYLAAYVAKSCDLDALPLAKLAEWAIETHGLRLAQTFGSLQHCKPQSEPPEPLPIRLIPIDPNDLAWDAYMGDPDAHRLLRLLEPGRRRPETPDAAEIAGLISAINHRVPIPRPPPLRRPNRQMTFRN